jgi:carbonic anhydrase
LASYPLLGFSQVPQAKALVLSCIDFRFISIEQNFLNQQLGGQYDLLTLAGASLALTGFPHDAEATTFWDQLELSRELHHIEKVIILDHQDCGAYAAKIDKNLSQDPQREWGVHRQYLEQAKQEIKQRYPQLSVELYFIGLDGNIKFHDYTENFALGF